MNNIQFWIWVIVIVVTFIARLRNKKQGAERNPPRNSSRPVPTEEQGSKPMTFEELLKEIQESKNPQPKAARKYEPTDYEVLVDEEPKSQEKAGDNYAQQLKTNEVYEKARQEAFLRPSLEETLKLDDTIIRFGQFKGYQHDQEVSPASAFAQELKNPSTFKKAFIISEILKRRF